MDFSYSEDHYELQPLVAQVQNEPENFEHWEALIRAAEQQEGGLSRNSNPQAIAATRQVYDNFLARFPLFFGYWKKYADLEFAIGGTESAEMVYERGVASIGISVDIWTNYCTFKIDTSHDSEVLRELFERAADAVGLDFLAHPFWDKWIEYEERFDAHDRIFAILGRIIKIPLHQYARYFERYRIMAARRPISELAPSDTVESLRRSIQQEHSNNAFSAADVEKELRTRLDAVHLEIHNKTAKETTQRWVYEQEIKRPYYHVTELDEPQLANWRKYLSFEEGEGDYARTKLLYERCLVTTANYDEFWFRYSRWVYGQSHLTKEVRNEEMRNILLRAACIFVPINRPGIRLQYARFEESLGNAATAIDVHESILASFPDHLETIISLANTHRRTHGVNAALKVLETYNTDAVAADGRGALVAESARMTWQIVGNVEAARQLFEDAKPQYLSSRPFWSQYFDFELQQPISGSSEAERHVRVKGVWTAARTQAQLPDDFLSSLASKYFDYLTNCGDSTAIGEYLEIDQQINGPVDEERIQANKYEDDQAQNHLPPQNVQQNGHAVMDPQMATFAAKGIIPHPQKLYGQQYASTG